MCVRWSVSSLCISRVSAAGFISVLIVRVFRTGSAVGLVQPFLVLQSLFPSDTQAFVELTVTDEKRTRRRLILSTAFKDVSSNELHAQVPLSLLKRGVWLNLCIDVAGLTHECFRQPFQSLEGIVIGAPIALRRVFSMRAPMIDTTDDAVLFDWHDPYVCWRATWTWLFFRLLTTRRVVSRLM
jgi:hypothetical protein